MFNDLTSTTNSYNKLFSIWDFGILGYIMLKKWALLIPNSIDPFLYKFLGR